jgi:hypothetical protein
MAAVPPKWDWIRMLQATLRTADWFKPMQDQTKMRSKQRASIVDKIVTTINVLDSAAMTSMVTEENLLEPEAKDLLGQFLAKEIIQHLEATLTSRGTLDSSDDDAGTGNGSRSRANSRSRGGANPAQGTASAETGNATPPATTTTSQYTAEEIAAMVDALKRQDQPGTLTPPKSAPASTAAAASTFAGVQGIQLEQQQRMQAAGTALAPQSMAPASPPQNIGASTTELSPFVTFSPEQMQTIMTFFNTARAPIGTHSVSAQPERVSVAPPPRARNPEDEFTQSMDFAALRAFLVKGDTTSHGANDVYLSGTIAKYLDKEGVDISLDGESFLTSLRKRSEKSARIFTALRSASVGCLNPGMPGGLSQVVFDDTRFILDAVAIVAIAERYVSRYPNDIASYRELLESIYFTWKAPTRKSDAFDLSSYTASGYPVWAAQINANRKDSRPSKSKEFSSLAAAWYEQCVKKTAEAGVPATSSSLPWTFTAPMGALSKIGPWCYMCGRVGHINSKDTPCKSPGGFNDLTVSFLRRVWQIGDSAYGQYAADMTNPNRPTNVPQRNQRDRPQNPHNLRVLERQHPNPHAIHQLGQPAKRPRPTTDDKSPKKKSKKDKKHRASSSDSSSTD